MLIYLSNLFLQLILVQLDTVLQIIKGQFSHYLLNLSLCKIFGCVSVKLLTSASVMDTRLVSMVGCRAMRLPRSCRDNFLSERRAL